MSTIRPLTGNRRASDILPTASYVIPAVSATRVRIGTAKTTLRSHRHGVDCLPTHAKPNGQLAPRSCRIGSPPLPIQGSFEVGIVSQTGVSACKVFAVWLVTSAEYQGGAF